MGQTTSIIVQSQPRPGEVKELFDHCRTLLGANGRHRWHEGPSAYMPGNLEYAMFPAQGLPVWLKIFHTPKGSLQGHDPDADVPAGSVEIRLDDGTRDSHARLVKDIGRWLKNRGWNWQVREHPDQPWRHG
ncbi:hypothetical protein [Actinomadura viridis]|uniref:Uncharacterized protein n=1 Tax=Actinomadura viridis TaxID=58110 RepID=A0A931DEY0_9ACTN|nr:hypothetical protein [Actinomadura viridis]MBG6089864.1 hypothetical protein [Actinomadura viridis]